MARRTLVRESETKGLAGIANDDVVLVFRCLSAVWKRRSVHWDRLSPHWVNPGSPHWHPAIQRLSICQNVAGLWLKYGANSLKIETSLRRKIPPSVATICWQQPLTMPIGRDYKPPTERGAVLAHGQGMFSCPW